MESGTVRIVVIGGSSGSLAPLKTILDHFPVDFGAAVLVAQHFPPDGNEGFWVNLLRKSALPIRIPLDGEELAPGHVYFAKRDHHLFLERGRVRVQQSPKELLNRPSINMLFRSAAAAYGNSVAGVLLSGMMSDGVAGLWDIKNAGGTTIVQSPYEAEFPSMPQSAIENVPIDHCLPARRIPRLLGRLAGPRSGWSANGKKARILVVEDDAAQAIDLEDQLRSLGYDVMATVATGEEALRAARDLPDLALVDIRLAGKMDGIETAALLRDRFKVGVIYTTSHDDEETIRRLRVTLPQGYLGKPIRPKDLHGAVEVALAARGVVAGAAS